jgi:hypothetical protein
VHRILTYSRRQGDTRIDWSRSIGSFQAEDLILTVRYGDSVLDRRTYRRILRLRLAVYAAFLVRNVTRAFFPGDPTFRDYHLTQLRTLEASNFGRSREVDAFVRLARRWLMPAHRRAQEARTR